MENYLTVLSANIYAFRKKAGLTQEEVANKTGVSFQAVSRWENAKSMPDISLLPLLADLFECSIDALFSREAKPMQSSNREIHYDLCADLPWEDDSVIRGVVFEGRKILQKDRLLDKFTFVLQGNPKRVKSECNIAVEGSVSGGCSAGKDLTVGGPISGGCAAGNDIVVRSSINGGCAARNDITATDITGSVTAANVTATSIEAKHVTGNVVVEKLQCDQIKGGVTIVQK